MSRYSVTAFLAAALSVSGLAGCSLSEDGRFTAVERDVTGSISPKAVDAAPPGRAAAQAAQATSLADDVALGRKYLREKDYDRAEKHFRRAVEWTPKDRQAWIGLAESYDGLRQFALADQTYDRALKVGPADADYLNSRAMSYFTRGDKTKARELWLSARAKDPDNPYIQRNLDRLDERVASAKAPQ